jgi:hypothetical protein
MKKFKSVNPNVFVLTESLGESEQNPVGMWTISIMEGGKWTPVYEDLTDPEAKEAMSSLLNDGIIEIQLSKSIPDQPTNSMGGFRDGPVGF